MNQNDAPEQTPSRSYPSRPAFRLRRLGAALATAVVVGAGVVGCGAGAAQEPAPTSDAPAAAVEPHVLNAGDVNAWLDEMLPAALEANDIAGATVAVVNDGGTVTTRGYGHVDTGSEGTEPVPVDPERHLFRIGSVSKLATATGAMQLVQDGRVDLDADIAAYLDFTIPATSTSRSPCATC